MGAIGAWMYYLIEGRKHMGVLSAVIIVTLTLGIPFEHTCRYNIWYHCTNVSVHMRFTDFMCMKCTDRLGR